MTHTVNLISTDEEVKVGSLFKADHNGLFGIVTSIEQGKIEKVIRYTDLKYNRGLFTVESLGKVYKIV